eukprot:2497115-Rhodomonas_salina.3
MEGRITDSRLVSQSFCFTGASSQRSHQPAGPVWLHGHARADDPSGPKLEKPPAGVFNVPGYPQQKIFAEQQQPVQYQEPEIPSLNQPIMPELDHRKFDAVDALETVPPFNP